MKFFESFYQFSCGQRSVSETFTCRSSSS